MDAGRSAHETHTLAAGHSLGAALADLTAVDLFTVRGSNSGKSVDLYTFGEPRVGNGVYANWTQQYLGNTWRAVHQSDIVPHLPPKDFGFVHEGNHHTRACSAGHRRD